MRKTAKWIAFLLAALMLLTLFGCGGKDGKRQSGKTNVQTTYEALCDYAKRLEEAGNHEAAERVYELLPKALTGSAVNDIEAGIADSSYGNVFSGRQSLDEWKDLMESAGDSK